MSASSKKRAVRKYADLPEEEKRHAKVRECYYRKIKKSLVDSDPAVTTTKTLICPGWETPVVPVSQPETPVRDKRRGCSFVPGLATGTNCPGWLSRLVIPTGTKDPFFSCFLFLNSFFISIILLHFN